MKNLTLSKNKSPRINLHSNPVYRLIHAFNTSPTFQFYLQLAGVVLGLLFLIAVPISVFGFPSFWNSVNLLALIEITNWGNFVTDYEGVAAAEASGHSAALRHFVVKRHLHHRFLHWIFDKIAVDPHFQYRTHLTLTYNWAVQGIIAGILFVIAPGFFNHFGLAYTLMQNGYTNVGTSMAALPDARAAMHLRDLRQGRSPWEPEPDD
jgi:hypothetical protein